MIHPQYLLSSQESEAAQLEQPAQSEPGSPQPEREKVRILIYGSRRAIKSTINQLHLLRFVEQFCWNPIAPIPENGIVITPAEAETYSFLVRELLID